MPIPSRSSNDQPNRRRMFKDPLSMLSYMTRLRGVWVSQDDQDRHVIGFNKVTPRGTCSNYVGIGLSDVVRAKDIMAMLMTPEGRRRLAEEVSEKKSSGRN